MDKLETLFCCATFFEAKSILDSGGFIKEGRDFFRKSNYGLLITGIGPANVRKAFEKRPWLQCERIVNIGFCAGVKGLKVGDCFSPELILNGDELHNCNICSSSLLLSFQEPLKKNHLLLKTYPCLGKAERIGVDMESLELLKWSTLNCSDLIINKIVSDVGEEDFFGNFKASRDIFLEKLINVAKKHLF